MTLMNLFTEQRQETDFENKHSHQSGNMTGGGDKLGVWG